MKGISKELPWPGSRCGWIEIYNREKDPDFKTYTQSILNSKMVEVCSTTLPQKVIPLIFEHPEHEAYLEKRRDRYKRMSETAYNKLTEIPSILINRTNGAFYMSVLFREGVLSKRQTLPIENTDIRSFIESLTSNGNVSLDKRFVYYLLAAKGVCVVPLSSFNTELQGFRFTLLDPDETSFLRMVDTLAEGIKTYV
jgi:aspartate/methionine/tyrosine aminotransferase